MLGIAPPDSDFRRLAEAYRPAQVAASRATTIISIAAAIIAVAEELADGDSLLRQHLLSLGRTAAS